MSRIFISLVNDDAFVCSTTGSGMTSIDNCQSLNPLSGERDTFVPNNPGFFLSGLNVQGSKRWRAGGNDGRQYQDRLIK